MLAQGVYARKREPGILGRVMQKAAPGGAGGRVRGACSARIGPAVSAATRNTQEQADVYSR